MTFLPPSCSGLCIALTLAVVPWDAPTALAGSHAPVSAAAAARVREQVSPPVRIALQDFERLVNEGNVVLIDVRRAHDYRQAHLPSAVSIPLEELEGAVARLGGTHLRIVLYCGGPAARRSTRAAALLRKHGFDRVYCLDGGIARWVASGRVVIVDPT